MNDDTISKTLAAKIEADLFAALTGPQQPQRQTALRYRGRRFEVVELDEAGNVIEPPPPCCYGRVLHAPNCPSWLYCT